MTAVPLLYTLCLICVNALCIHLTFKTIAKIRIVLSVCETIKIAVNMHFKFHGEFIFRKFCIWNEILRNVQNQLELSEQIDSSFEFM